MSNRITVVKNNLITGLETLVPANLKAVKQHVINSLNQPDLPVLGLVIADWRRLSGSTWTANLLLMLVTMGETDDAAIELAAKITAAVDAVADSDAPGGCIDTPSWDAWHTLGAGGVMKRVGALGRVRIRVEDPVAI